jgi:enoyl-CoA hydratase/carnithine racemase
VDARYIHRVKLEREGTLAVVTLKRPSRRNALYLDLMYELTDCLSAIGRDREIHAVILAAAGSVFCSGHDRWMPWKRCPYPRRTRSAARRARRQVSGETLH